MSDNLLAGRGLQPLILTHTQLRSVLLPITLGYAWGESTIKDLFSRCAPLPGAGVERRIIAPNHLGEWLSDVLQRQGRPMNEQARIYNQLASGAPHHGRRITG